MQEARGGRDAAMAATPLGNPEDVVLVVRAGEEGLEGLLGEVEPLRELPSTGDLGQSHRFRLEAHPRSRKGAGREGAALPSSGNAEKTRRTPRILFGST